MLKKFYPSMTVDKIQDIDLEFLKLKKIRGLILDIDNTLVPEHVEKADEAVTQWIKKVKEHSLEVCIVSNAKEKRVKLFNQDLKINAIHRAGKPGSKAFVNAANKMKIELSETAVIGDQLFTDIYGGNKLNMFTILVKPIDERELLSIRVKRIAEKFVLASYHKKK